MTNYLEAFRLDGRVALVAGGGGGIGSAISAGLAGAGAKVAVLERTAERGEPVLTRLREAGDDAMVVEADVTDRQAVERAVAETVDRWERLDVIVNAVGGRAGDALHPAEEYPAEDWDWIVNLNLLSTVVATQAAVRAMIRLGKGGRVLNISSVRGQLGINAGYAAYVAAKGAINALRVSGPSSGPSTTSMSTPSRRLLSTPPRWRPCWATRCSRLASSLASRWDASAGPMTCSVQCSCSAPTRRPSSRVRSSPSTVG